MATMTENPAAILEADVPKKPAAVQKPKIVEKLPQKMAVVHAKGDPNKITSDVLSALYEAVYKLKFDLKKQGHDFKVGAPRACWPNALNAPRDQWVSIWGLPIPDDVTTIEPKVPGIPIKIEVWEYGTVAEIVHIGSYSEEGPSIRRLHEFIKESGYEIVGLHEEEYLTTPATKVQKTIIRYPVRRVEG